MPREGDMLTHPRVDTGILAGSILWKGLKVLYIELYLRYPLLLAISVAKVQDQKQEFMCL